MQGNSNVVAASTAGANVGGVSGVSLRGLWSQRTLVLVNGRRLSGGGTITDSTSVDVNSIPLAAIDHVEVYKNGGSAVYGSDAIAGVINFVIETASRARPRRCSAVGRGDGGGGIKRANGALGTGDLATDPFNVMLTASYQKENPLFGRDRSFSKSGINAGALNDVIRQRVSGQPVHPRSGELALPGASGTTINPLAPNNCAPSVVSPLQPDDRCRYDFLRTSHCCLTRSACPPSVQLTSISRTTCSCTRRRPSRNEQEFVIQPAPISDQFNLPPGHPLSNLAP